jgi:hypothetical protein
MGTTPILDLVERLLRAARHPDITDIRRYGPGHGPWGPTAEKSKVKAITGVKVTHQSTSTAMLWEAVDPDAVPVSAPPMPPPARRAIRLPLFVARLLDVAQPTQLRSWQLAASPHVGLEAERGVVPYGLMLVGVDGSRTLLMCSATGPTVGREPTEEPFPDYTIPEEVKTCLQEADAASAAPASA